MAKEPANQAEARELAIYAVNDSQTYNSCGLPVIKNMARKIKRGTYDQTLALKGWRHVADYAANRYRKEFSMIGGFSPATRDAAAAEIMAHYESAVTEQAAA